MVCRLVCLPYKQASIVMSLAKIKRNESPKSNSGESVEGQCKKVPGDKIESGDQLKSYGKWQLEMKYCKRRLMKCLGEKKKIIK